MIHNVHTSNHVYKLGYLHVKNLHKAVHNTVDGAQRENVSATNSPNDRAHMRMQELGERSAKLSRRSSFQPGKQ